MIKKETGTVYKVTDDFGAITKHTKLDQACKVGLASIILNHGDPLLFYHILDNAEKIRDILNFYLEHKND